MAGSQITTHVLDTARGQPAKGMKAVLERWDDTRGGWAALARGETDADGRIRDLLAPGTLVAGRYRLTFAAGAWLRSVGSAEAFYDSIPVEFTISAVDRHYHVPLLLSPFGYSTYRGS